MDQKIKTAVDAILTGMEIKEAISLEETPIGYDAEWEEKVHKKAAELFGKQKELWDLMAFAPEKYNRDALQDALNAFSKWYQDFLAVKKGE